MKKRKCWNGLEVKKFVEDENYSLIKIENWDWVKKEAEKSFTKTKKHDIIKNEYAKQNNIPLLRIPYYESDNIESILIQWLKDEGVL